MADCAFDNNVGKLTLTWWTNSDNVCRILRSNSGFRFHDNDSKTPLNFVEGAKVVWIWSLSSATTRILGSWLWHGGPKVTVSAVFWEGWGFPFRDNDSKTPLNFVGGAKVVWIWRLSSARTRILGSWLWHGGPRVTMSAEFWEAIQAFDFMTTTQRLRWISWKEQK
jgi:hypothetical protein